MIKDKITPELKNAFLESIKKVKETEKEHGFLMCADKEGKLSVSERECKGNLCYVVVDQIPGACPEKVQGLFHIHAQKPILEMMFDRKMTDKDVEELVAKSKEPFKKKGITLQTPSHQDVLTTLLSKCEKQIEGTICTGSDLETDKLECWTTKIGAANKLTCTYAKIDSKITKEMFIEPKRWIRPLFDKEIINLK